MGRQQQIRERLDQFSHELVEAERKARDTTRARHEIERKALQAECGDIGHVFIDQAQFGLGGLGVQARLCCICGTWEDAHQKAIASNLTKG